MTICRLCEKSLLRAEAQFLRLRICRDCDRALTDELTRPPARRTLFYISTAEPKFVRPFTPASLRKSA